MKLLIRNLSKVTTEEKLTALFREHGTVQSCSLVLDKETGKSKGFGFIEMPKVGEAKAAMKTLNGYKLAGNNIRVKKAEIKKELKDPISNDKNEQVDNNEGNSSNIYGAIKQSES